MIIVTAYEQLCPINFTLLLFHALKTRPIKKYT